MGTRYTLFLLILTLCFTAGIKGQNTVVITGTITDSAGIPVEQVNIVIKGTTAGTITDKKGRFTIRTKPVYPITLQISSVGYNTKEYTINKGDKTSDIKIGLTIKNEQIAEVNVKGDRTNGSLTKIDANLANVLPDAGGGNIEGLVKTQLGVTSNNELSSSYRVRGGNYDENLVYVNDIEVYRPFLIRAGQQEGLSFVNPDLVSSVKFSPGGFNTEYGDKMSSVLDIKYKQPEEFAGSASVSLLGATAHVEGTDKNKKLSYIAGIRYKTNKYMLGTMDVSGDYNPDFFDAQAYLTYHFNKTWMLEGLGYYSRNSYNFIPEDRETEFGTINEAKKLKIYFEGEEKDLFNTGFASVALTHLRNTKNRYKVLVSAFRTVEEETYDILGQYWLQEMDKVQEEEQYEEGVSNIGVGSYLQHARNSLVGDVQNIALRGKHRFNEHLVTWQVKYQHESFSDYINEWEMQDSAGYSIPSSPEKLELAYSLNMDIDISTHRMTGYLQDEYQWKTDAGNLFFNYGVRFNYWSFNNELLISPRANVSFIPADKQNLRLRASVGVYDQSPFYKELRLPDGTINHDIKAQKSIHYVLGGDLYFNINEKPFKFTTEAYYKHMKDLIPYYIDNVRIRYTGVNSAKGYATGIDMKVSGELVKGLESWATLSVMQTKEDILNDFYIETDEDGNQHIVYPGYIPRPSDQRVNFSLFFQDYLPQNPTFKVHLNMIFGSGLPFGPPRSPRYKATLRMPPYRRVDIGFSKDFTSVFDKNRKNKTFKRFWVGLEIFNLFNINNTISYFWVTDVDNRQYAVPNYLTSRRINLNLHAEF
ncbi:MAG: TonB-dependent receptor plug domain-containing protein [Chlorobi bacterium]|nr:TonB-dependent receptor plug domain-containing protein [Chlorobiota bacterium]